MRQKIFGSMAVLVLISVTLSSILIMWLMYTRICSSMRQSVRNEAVYAATAVNTYGADYLQLEKDTADSSRITHIAENGTVLFDSKSETDDTADQLALPEVSAAIQTGMGQDERLASNLGTQTFYYAVRLNDGSVLKIGDTTSSVYLMLLTGLPYILLIYALVIIIAMFLAKHQTQRMVVPINSLDLDDPLSNETYDELTPILSRLEGQKRKINTQMRELKEQQEEFYAVTENMEEGLVILNSRLDILSINKTALRVFGVKQGNYRGRHILTINRSPEMQLAVTNALSGKADEKFLLLFGRTYQLLANPVRSEEVLRGIVLLIIDITEKRNAENMRREFSANVSHELKTPLTSISGYAEIIKNGLVKPEDIQEFAGRIYSEARRLITLVEDIIKLSRLDEADLELPSESVELLSLSREICSRLSSLAAKTGISLSVVGEEAFIVGNKQVLDEMIFNLCENAIKYNHENGSVVITVSHAGGAPFLTVADTGIGIPKQHQARVFERFYRVEKSHSRETGGTGLGLSIVRHAAIYHHARLELDSEPGRGTTIRVIFPRQNQEENA